MTKSKVFLYFLLVFLGGVAVASFLYIPSIITLSLILASVFAITLFFRRGSKLIKPKIALIALLVIVFSLGIIRFNKFDSDKMRIKEFNDKDTEILMKGYIDDEPRRLSDKQKLILKVKEINPPGSDFVYFLEGRILITTDRFPEYHYGDFVEVEANLKAPENFTDFDYQAYLAKDKIYSVTYWPKISQIGNYCDSKDNGLQFEKFKFKTKFECVKISLFKNIFNFKEKFQNAILSSVPEPNAAYLTGILLGTRTGFSQELTDAFNRTGTTHILAISGWNITIIVWVLSSMLLLFFKRNIAFWFSAAGIILFTILTGAEASVIRAAIMGFLILLAYGQGRIYNVTNAIVFAGFLMVLFNPRVLRFDAGFQLSFLATLGLIYFSPFIKKYFRFLPEFFKIKENVVMTVSAQLMVLPLLLFNFKNFSLTSLPANILVLPLTPLSMLLGFLSGISGMLWSFLGQIFGMAAWAVSIYQLSVIKFFAGIPLSSFPISIHWIFLVVSYVLIFCFLIRKLTK